MRRVLIGITGASGSIFAMEFLRRCPAEKFLILSRWGKSVLHQEAEITVDKLSPYVKRIYSAEDLNSPFASGSNIFDAYVIVPCSMNTLGKIAHGISDNLITRAAGISLKERRRLILCIRETPLSTVDLENAWKISRSGAIVMPISPPFYTGAQSVQELASDFADRIVDLLGLPSRTRGWRAEELNIQKNPL